MQANSRQVSSNQPHLHPKLAAVVRRHLATPYRRPSRSTQHAAYEASERKLRAHGRWCWIPFAAPATVPHAWHSAIPTIWCWASTNPLNGWPDTRTVAAGIYLLLQADCEDIWQLLVRDRLVAAAALPALPQPLAQSQTPATPRSRTRQLSAAAAAGWRYELRSNWQLYVEEFGLAMHLAGCRGQHCNGRRRAGPDPVRTKVPRQRSSLMAVLRRCVRRTVTATA